MTSTMGGNRTPVATSMVTVDQGHAVQVAAAYLLRNVVREGMLSAIAGTSPLPWFFGRNRVQGRPPLGDRAAAHREC